MGCQVCWGDTVLQSASLYVHSFINKRNGAYLEMSTL